MGSGAEQEQKQCVVIFLVDQEPIRPDVALPLSLRVTMQSMIEIGFWQNLPRCQKVNRDL